MADEKIINEEVLSEDELDEVAGGYGKEIKDDKKRFEKLGIKITSDAHDEAQLKGVFDRFGIKVETYHGSLTPNSYYDKLNDKTVNRDEAWKLVYDRKKHGW